MILKYENTVEDLVALNRYHSFHSPEYRRLKFKSMLTWSVVIIAAAVFVPENALFNRAENIFCGVILAAVVCLATYWGFDAESVKRLYGEDGINDFAGEVELEINCERITERKDDSETSKSWATVNKIVETDDYVFIYLMAMSAVVIPKNSILAGVFDQFVDQARNYWLAAKPNQSTGI